MAEDLEDEFFAFWGGEFCILDIYPGDPGALSVVTAGRSAAAKRLTFVSSDVKRTLLKLKAMGLDSEVHPSATAFKVRTKAKPHPQQGVWPPSTVAALLQWQGLLDPAARRNIERRLLVACSAGKSAALCVVESPLTQYAFWVRFEDSVETSSRSVADFRVRLFASKVHPMTEFRMDDRYITQRNNPGRPTLAGMRIALLGCGTIGGYLAELLVKSGAGLEGGELLLVDPDMLMSQNIGRHRLGLNYSLRMKAEALRDELLAGMPTAAIRAFPVRAQEVDLSKVDAVINATGEEAIGHLLTRDAGAAGKFVPNLSTWIEGPGVAVRSLIRDQPQTGCTRCLGDLTRKPLFPVSNEPMPVELAGHGCESLYVPFPATVSVQAACLASEMLMDWVAGSPSPRLRTRITRAGFTQAAPDGDVGKNPDCPACSS